MKSNGGAKFSCNAYKTYLFFVLFTLFYSVKPFICTAQEKTNNYFFSLKIGPPIAISKTTFKTSWYPMADVGISVLKQSYANLYAGLEFEYSGFHVGEWTRLKSRLHIFNPNIMLGYDVPLFEKLILFADFSFGYSWMRFTNSITPSKYIQPYYESGFNVKPGFSISYLFKNKLSLGLSSSYKIIFEKFGSENAPLYENTSEANNTTYLNVCLCLGFSF